MNMAQVWKLPVIFVCENNLYGEFSHILHDNAYEDLIIRAAGYSMAAEKVDGDDALAVYEAAAAAVARAREGEGTTFSNARPIAIAATLAPIRPSIAMRLKSRLG